MNSSYQFSIQTITQHIDDWLTNRTLLIFGNAHKIGAGKVIKSIGPSVKFRCFSGHGRRDFLNYKRMGVSFFKWVIEELFQETKN